MGYVLIAGGFDAAIPLTRMRIFLDTAEGRIWTDMDGYGRIWTDMDGYGRDQVSSKF